LFGQLHIERHCPIESSTMISLLVLLPVVLLVLASLGIVILQQARPSIGYAWLIGAVLGMATVAAVLFLRWRLPLQVTVEQWRAFAGLSNPIAFQLDLSSWPYVFGLAVLAAAFMLTDAARLESEGRPFNWAAGLSLTGLGMLAVMSANPITLVVTWTAVDLVESVMIISAGVGTRMGAQTVTVFFVRVTGTLLVIAAVLFARSRGILFDLTPIPSLLAIFMLLAVGLRLGVLPLNIPYTTEAYAWRGLGNVMRMIGPASSLVVLGRMPEQVVPVEWKALFLALSAMAAIYGAVMWLVAEDEIQGRPYWLITLAALAVASVINGSPRASIAWGMALIFSGSVLFFFSARRRQILFIPLLGILGVAGLPYSPAAAGWPGVVSGPITLFSLLFVLSVLCLVWGYLRHTMRPREELYRMERWVHTIYPTGLMFLVLGQWVTGVFGWPGSLTTGVWWAAIALALVGAFGGILAFFFRRVLASGPMPVRWFIVFAQRAGGVLGAILRLNWLYQFLNWLYRVLQSLIQLLTAMLEGDGGILWTLVMLALLISLVQAGGKP
jgi:hypothetical protein